MYSFREFNDSLLRSSDVNDAIEHDIRFEFFYAASVIHITIEQRSNQRIYANRIQLLYSWK